MQKFPARLDGLSRTLSLVVVMVLIIPFSSIFFEYQKSHEPLLLIAPVVIVLALGVAALFRPTAYELNATDLKIILPAKTNLIPIKDIRSIESVSSKELGFGIRAFGSGGFLGYFGSFYYKNQGWIRLYATDRSKMLLIVTKDDRKYVISPDDTEGFLKSFRSLNR